MEAFLAAAGIAAGIFLAFGAGSAVRARQHAVENLRKTKESIPGLKKTAWSAWRRATLWLLPLGAFVALVAYWVGSSWRS